jgi:hypothetical protein
MFWTYWGNQNTSEGTKIPSGMRLTIPLIGVCQSLRDLQRARKKRNCFNIAYRVATFSKPLSTPIQQNLISLFEKMDTAYPEIVYDKVDMKKTLPTGICLLIIIQYNSNDKGKQVSSRSASHCFHNRIILRLRLTED